MPSQSTFIFCVFVDGELVGGNQSLSASASRGVRSLSRRYSALFEERAEPHVAAESLQALGRGLFDLWLAPTWDQVTARVPVGARRLFLIASDVPDVLNLPWELLRPPDSDFVAFDSRFGIRRLP